MLSLQEKTNCNSSVSMTDRKLVLRQRMEGTSTIQ